MLLAAAIALAFCLSALAGHVIAAAEPRISVSPTGGPLGTQIAISGQGFLPGDTVFLEIAPTGAPHPYRIGNVYPDPNGQFFVIAELGIVYPGPPLPEPAPPGGGQRVNFAPGDYQIRAYPVSFGPRLPDAIATAPTVPFTVTAGSLPNTGGEPGSDQRGLPAELVVGLLLALIGIACWRTAST